MASFNYKGRDASGGTVEGVLDGASAEAVTSLLFGRGITPLEVKATEEEGDFDLNRFFKPKILHEDIALFTRQLNTLLKAGVPIMRALAGLQDSATNLTMRDLIGNLREDLDSGREFAMCIGRHSSVFSSFYISMIRVGEMTGRLEDILLRLYHQPDGDPRLRQGICRLWFRIAADDAHPARLLQFHGGLLDASDWWCFCCRVRLPGLDQDQARRL
jgi:MSHA biogenesis protein MshG